MEKPLKMSEYDKRIYDGHNMELMAIHKAIDRDKTAWLKEQKSSSFKRKKQDPNSEQAADFQRPVRKGDSTISSYDKM